MHANLDANKFKDKFEECQADFTKISSSDSSDKLADDLGKLNVEECGENGEIEKPQTDGTEGEKSVASPKTSIEPLIEAEKTKTSTESSTDTEIASKKS